MSESGLPLYDREDVRAALETGSAATPRVAGVVFAGGRSSRFGDGNKLLASLDGEPVVRHAASTLVDADLADTVVVLGHEAAAVRSAVTDLGARCVMNSAYERGMSTSVVRGVRAVANADAVVFLPGDMPLVASDTVGLLVRGYRAGIGTALAAAHDGRRGNPVLFGHTHFEDLRSLDGDTGGLPVLLDGTDSALVETGDPGTRRDVDTGADLDRLR